VAPSLLLPALRGCQPIPLFAVTNDFPLRVLYVLLPILIPAVGAAAALPGTRLRYSRRPNDVNFNRSNQRFQGQTVFGDNHPYILTHGQIPSASGIFQQFSPMQSYRAIHVPDIHRGDLRIRSPASSTVFARLDSYVRIRQGNTCLCAWYTKAFARPRAQLRFRPVGQRSGKGPLLSTYTKPTRPIHYEAGIKGRIPPNGVATRRRVPLYQWAQDSRLFRTHCRTEISRGQRNTAYRRASSSSSGSMGLQRAG